MTEPMTESGQVERAARRAIARAKARGAAEVVPDDLLVGALSDVSRFGVAWIGRWAVDVGALAANGAVEAPDAPVPAPRLRRAHRRALRAGGRPGPGGRGRQHGARPPPGRLRRRGVAGRARPGRRGVSPPARRSAGVTGRTEGPAGAPADREMVVEANRRAQIPFEAIHPSMEMTPDEASAFTEGYPERGRISGANEARKRRRPGEHPPGLRVHELRLGDVVVPVADRRDEVVAVAVVEQTGLGRDQEDEARAEEDLSQMATHWRLLSRIGGDVRVGS